MAAANLVVRAPAPLPFFIARATGAHQPDGLGAPDQGTVRVSDSAFGPSRGINPNRGGCGTTVSGARCLFK